MRAITTRSNFLFFLLPRMEFKLALAKKIIIGAPFFSRHDRYFPPFFTEIPRVVDRTMQDWALTRSDFFSKATWRAIQIAKIKKILVHAGNNVPYWGRLFQKVNFRPETFADFSDLQKIPVTTRADIKQNSRKEFLAANMPVNRFVPAATSGSTGEPLSFFHDTADLLLRSVNNFHELRYAGLLGGNIVIFGLGARKDLDGFGTRIEPLDLESSVLRREKIYPLLRSLEPITLLTTPSYLERFAYFCREEKFIPRIVGVHYCGESLGEAARQNLKQLFSCNILSVYGTQECSIIGLNCKEGKFHAAPWMNYVESVPVPGTSMNKLVVTLFGNFTMPFIRYDIGDTGLVVDEPCGCGRSSYSIKFEGRSLGFLRASGGETIPVSYISQFLAECYMEEVERFQIEEISSGKYILRIIPAKVCTGAVLTKIKSDLMHLTEKAGIFWEVEGSGYLRTESSGKTPILVKPTPGV